MKKKKKNDYEHEYLGSRDSNVALNAATKGLGFPSFF